jgi:ABC-type multidrug transport system ATPase subunit
MREPVRSGSGAALDLLAATKAANSQFKFKDVKFTVATKRGDKAILQGITGGVNSGEVLAIMGPSGAGKTCLMDVLTVEDKGGASVGDVRLNGHAMSKSIFTRYCATVPQQDKHWAFLICRETVAFAADLYLDLPTVEKTQRVDAVLGSLGLSGCAHTKVGNAFFAGLSAGAYTPPLFSST